MALTTTRYKNYEEFLNSDLASDGNFRLLSNGEVVELPPEDKENDFLASELTERLKRLLGNRRLVSTSTEIQVHPVGDNRVNRRPDVTVLRPEHLELMDKLKKNAILFGMPAPCLAVELVSPGGEGSANYRRDYEWKKQQYEWWQIPEYWIIDRHEWQVVVFVLEDGRYQSTIFTQVEMVDSRMFPTLNLSAERILSGDIFYPEE